MKKVVSIFLLSSVMILRLYSSNPLEKELSNMAGIFEIADENIKNMYNDPWINDLLNKIQSRNNFVYISNRNKDVSILKRVSDSNELKVQTNKQRIEKHKQRIQKRKFSLDDKSYRLGDYSPNDFLEVAYLQKVSNKSNKS